MGFSNTAIADMIHFANDDQDAYSRYGRFGRALGNNRRIGNDNGPDLESEHASHHELEEHEHDVNNDNIVDTVAFCVSSPQQYLGIGLLQEFNESHQQQSLNQQKNCKNSSINDSNSNCTNNQNNNNSNNIKSLKKQRISRSILKSKKYTGTYNFNYDQDRAAEDVHRSLNPSQHHQFHQSLPNHINHLRHTRSMGSIDFHGYFSTNSKSGFGMEDNENSSANNIGQRHASLQLSQQSLMALHNAQEVHSAHPTVTMAVEVAQITPANVFEFNGISGPDQAHSESVDDFIHSSFLFDMEA